MSTQPAVLVILGTRADPHVERVARVIEQRGDGRVFVLDYFDDTRFSLEEDETGRIAFEVNGTRLPERYLVWDRMKIMPGTDLYIRGDETSAGYAAQEWRAFYQLICGLNGERVVNSLASRSCMIKPYQQAIAARVGFRVPPTLLTNDRSSAQAFQRRNGDRIIMKSVSAGKVRTAGDGENIPFNVMTMRVAPEDLESATPDEVAYCPHFFQREILKSYELRVVVVGDRVMAFRIDSQKHELSELDWRKGMEIAGFTAVPLDDRTIALIRGFMRATGLFTGSLDLIVDRDQQVWFLECNQDGAWGWLDNLAEGAIAREFADAFASRLRVLAGELRE